MSHGKWVEQNDVQIRLYKPGTPNGVDLNDKQLFEHFPQCHYYVAHCRKDQADQALGQPLALQAAGVLDAPVLKLALCSVFMKTLTLKMGLAASQTDLDPP